MQEELNLIKETLKKTRLADNARVRKEKVLLEAYRLVGKSDELIVEMRKR